MSIKIEEGKFYRRRDGTKAGPMKLIGGGNFQFRNESDGELYTSSGNYWGYAATDHRDLVAEWVDEPPAPEPAPEQPDIKVGQHWTWLGKMASDSYTKGKSYEIMSVGIGSLTIEDDKGRLSNDGRGHYWPVEFFPRYFTPAPSAAQTEAGAEIAAEQPDIKAEIADEAKRIVSGARRSAYGKPEQNFERIARFWQAYFENTGRGAVNITAADVSPMMRLMKEARLCETSDHRDSFVDLVGYTLTGAEVNGVKAGAA